METETSTIPSFTIAANDDIAADALGTLATFYEAAGAPKAVVKAMRAKASEMKKWQLDDIAAHNEQLRKSKAKSAG